MKRKNKNSYCISLTKSHPRLRYFRSEMKIKTSFHFAFRSLIRIFANVNIEWNERK